VDSPIVYRFEDMSNVAVAAAFELTQNSVRTGIQLPRM
jgi:hypothetical protein